jgi:hypothetical protein
MSLSDFYPAIVKNTVVVVDNCVSKKDKQESFVSKVISHYHPKGEELNINYIIENKPPRKTVIEYLRNFVDTLENSDSE